MIGSYGNIIFEVSSEKILNLTDLSTTYGGNWASQDLISGKPRKQFIGATTATATFNMLLKADLGVKPSEMLENLRKKAEEGSADYLIIGGKLVCENKMVITSLSGKFNTIYSGGEIASISVSISLEEYV